MKKINIILLLFSIVLLGGCRKGFQPVENTKVAFQLIFPDTYNAGFYPENIPVTIKNNITGEIQTILSNSQGRVELDLLPGTYSLTASKAYSAEEAFPITGYDNETFVNASLSPVVIDQEKTVEVQLVGSQAGGLVIREFYYTGSKTPANTNYLYDGFIEIYNNSNTDIRVDSLYMGVTKFSATNNNATSTYNFVEQSPDFVYLSQVFMIPQIEDKPRFLEPGGSVVIAVTAINHRDPSRNPNSPVNLGPGISDFEVYWVGSNSTDVDVPEVPNMVHKYWTTNAGFDWGIGTNGSSLVIFNVNDFDALDKVKEPDVAAATLYLEVPVRDVLDGVDVTANQSILPTHKRLPVGVDAGLTTVNETYSGRSVRRKVKTVVNGRTVFVDTNNSSSDFEINYTPSPRQWN